MAASYQPAELTLQLPAEGDVWHDGKTVTGTGTTRVLFFPPLKPGENHTFNIRLLWTKDGAAFEAERRTEVKPGRKQQVDHSGRHACRNTPGPK